MASTIYDLAEAAGAEVNLASSVWRRFMHGSLFLQQGHVSKMVQDSVIHVLLF